MMLKIAAVNKVLDSEATKRTLPIEIPQVTSLKILEYLLNRLSNNMIKLIISLILGRVEILYNKLIREYMHF